jgi:hypothetical protein
MKIFKGFYDSRNFSFEVFSKTKAGAATAIRKALEDHTRQYDLDDDWIYEQDIFVVEYKLDTGYRDMSEIKTERTEA